MEHPFADDEGLLFTIDRSLTAGEARAVGSRARGRAHRLGRPAGISGRGRAAERSRGRHHDDRRMAGGRRVRTREPALSRGGSHQGARRDRAGCGHRRRRCDAARDRARLRARRGVRDVDVGHHRRAESHSSHPRGVSGAARPRPRATPRRGCSHARSRAEAVSQPHSGVARSERRHLQRAVRNARRRRARDHGQLPAGGVRRARTALRDPLDGAAARCDGDALRRRRRHRPHDHCATCGASPPRCRHSKRAGSRASSARRC